jgi:hypothetical protein
MKKRSPSGPDLCGFFCGGVSPADERATALALYLQGYCPQPASQPNPPRPKPPRLRSPACDSYSTACLRSQPSPQQAPPICRASSILDSLHNSTQALSLLVRYNCRSAADRFPFPVVCAWQIGRSTKDAESQPERCAHSSKAHRWHTRASQTNLLGALIQLVLARQEHACVR